jgi:nickel-dependent lactate racemase
MKTRLAYGRGRLEVELPAGARELRMGRVEPLARPTESVLDALRRPLGAPSLREVAAGRRQACIVVSDITRPVPYRLLLPPVLAELEGVAGRVTLLVATGTHRPSTGAEKLEMFGPEAVARHAIVDHDSRDPSQLVALGRQASSGADVRVNRLYAEADLKILTGLVEPHFMAGYSGGRKAICPGLVDLRTIQKFHGPRFLEDPNAASGVLEGNPCHQEASEVAHIVGADFILNVALDLERRVVGVFAGDLDAAFAAAVSKVDSTCRAEAGEPADIVVTSGGGYPLDKTFYQTVKGMVAALPVVREGGAILIASECSEGIGNREYAELMLRYEGRHEQFIPDILARDEVAQDQWEFEEQCKVLARVGVVGLVVCTGGIPPATLERLSVTPAARLCAAGDRERQLQGALDALLAARPGAKVIAIPEGPYVLACCSPP